MLNIKTHIFCPVVLLPVPKPKSNQRKKTSLIYIHIFYLLMTVCLHSDFGLGLDMYILSQLLLIRMLIFLTEGSGGTINIMIFWQDNYRKKKLLPTTTHQTIHISHEMALDVNRIISVHYLFTKNIAGNDYHCSVNVKFATLANHISPVQLTSKCLQRLDEEFLQAEISMFFG